MKNLKRLTAAAVAVTMQITMFCMPIMAAEPTNNGVYHATVHFYNASNPTNLSMCDTLFAHSADLAVTDEGATLTTYVAYPVPGFPDQGTDGTLKDVSAKYGENAYVATSDITSKPTKEFDTTNAMFGITAGQSYECQVLSFALPRAAVEQLETGLNVSAFVNVVMNTNVDFIMKVTDLIEKSAPIQPVTETKSVEVTANVVAPAATYYVQVPETIGMGELSKTQDTSKRYDVNVSVANLGNGKISVSTPTTGELKSGEDSLAFENSFVTQEFKENKTVSGEIKIGANAVANAKAGNYTGTTSFVINYYAQ